MKDNVNLRVNNVVDDNTLNFIKDFEKLHLHSYKCSGGKWSIGLEKVYNDILNRIDKE